MVDTIEYFPMAESLDSLKLPFSEAVRVGSMLYLSGAMGIDASGALVPGGIEAETRQALANIRSVLERHGSSMDRVVKCTVMLADMGEWAAMNRVYIEHVLEGSARSQCLWRLRPRPRRPGRDRVHRHGRMTRVAMSALIGYVPPSRPPVWGPRRYHGTP